MKRLVGLLCYVSFVSTVGFTVYYSYLVMAPFFRGGELRVYYDYDRRHSVFHEFSSHGVNESAESLLQGYAASDDLNYVARGWAALPQLVETWDTAKIPRPETHIIWAGVADAGGKVVGTYPSYLAKTFGRVRDDTREAWIRAMNKHSDNRLRGQMHIHTLWSPSGKEIGSAAVVTKPYERVAVIPPGAEIHGRMSPLGAIWGAILCLLAFTILLPTWVALDADWRGMRPFAWAALIILTGPIGLAAYLISRSAPPKTCPNCGEAVFSKFKRCPACGVALPSKCPTCGTPFKPGWQYCPKCNTAATGTTERGISPPSPVSDAPALESGSALSVIALDADGVPVANVGVSIDGPSPMRGITNAVGTFAVRTAKPGVYMVKATAPGYEPAQAEAEVSEGVPKTVRIVLKALSAGIVGRVVERSSTAPLVGAYVYLDTSRVDVSALTGDDGRYDLEDVPPGHYTVAVKAEGFAPQTKLAEIRPGQRLPADFALDPLAPKEDQ